MQQFEIIIKNNKIKSYRLIALFILFLNFSIFLFLSLYDEYRVVAVTSILALLFYIILRWLVFKKHKPALFFDEFVFFIPAMCWFGFHNYILLIALVIMGILFKFSIQKIKFLFTTTKVSKINFPKKDFEWPAFNNVVLKDDILTLDFKNNKLIQVEIDDPQGIDETQFNSFAKSQIVN